MTLLVYLEASYFLLQRGQQGHLSNLLFGPEIVIDKFIVRVGKDHHALLIAFHPDDFFVLVYLVYQLTLIVINQQLCSYQRALDVQEVGDADAATYYREWAIELGLTVQEKVMVSEIIRPEAQECLTGLRLDGLRVLSNKPELTYLAHELRHV